MTFQELDQVLGDHAPFLISLTDGPQEALRLVIAPAAVGPAGSDVPDLEDMDPGTQETLQGILAKTRPIQADDGRQYEITFPGYILYQVRSESFCTFDPEDVHHGRYLIIFEQSKLLSDLPHVTDACQLADGSFYPGPWVHYGIYCQNHVIDVISHCPPEIQEIYL